MNENQELKLQKKQEKSNKIFNHFQTMENDVILEDFNNPDMKLENSKLFAFLYDYAKTTNTNPIGLKTNLKSWLSEMVAYVNHPQTSNMTTWVDDAHNFDNKVQQFKQRYGLNASQLENLKMLIVDHLSKDVSYKRKSIYQLQQLINQHKINENFKYKTTDLNQILKSSLTSNNLNPFMYSKEDYDDNAIIDETIDILINENAISTIDAKNLLNHKQSINPNNQTFIKVVDYLPYKFENYSSIQMLAKWNGLSVLDVIYNQDVKKIVVFSKNSNYDAKKIIDEAYSNNLTLSTPNQLALQQKLLDYEIYVEMMDKEEFIKLVMNDLGIKDKEELESILKYNDKELMYSNQKTPIKFVSNKELVGFDKKLMFLTSLVPSASSLTSTFFDDPKKLMQLNPNQIINAIKSTTLNSKKMQEIVYARLEKKTDPLFDELFNSIKLSDFKNLDYHSKVKYLESKQIHTKQFNKYLSFGSYFEDKIIDYFNTKKYKGILTQKRTMDVSSIYNVPLLMNIDGFKYNDDGIIDEVVEIKTTSSDFSNKPIAELKNYFKSKYWLQGMFYANTLNAPYLKTLIYLNTKNAKKKYYEIDFNENEIIHPEFISTLSDFYKKFYEVLNENIKNKDEKTMQYLKNLNIQFKYLKEMVVDLEFKDYVNQYNTILDLIVDKPKTVIKPKKKDDKEEY